MIKEQILFDMENRGDDFPPNYWQQLGLIFNEMLKIDELLHKKLSNKAYKINMGCDIDIFISSNS